MKTTGFIVMMVGIAIALFAGGAMVAGPTDALQTGAGNPEIGSNSYLYAPLVFGLIVLGVGAAIMVFGGKGYFANRTPNTTRPALS